ncbi:MAG TPA: alpha/beta hydrolase [Firmicutes bacterium]|nr:alpha/beta hydrolase [Bacillota bacterium]
MPYFEYRDKSIFYQEYGQGDPVVFLHGNTASSKMFELLMPLYAEKFRCILIDFLGNGRSERVESFSPDMWYDEALQTVTLIERLNCEKVALIGTSGGAWAAVNAALERPELVRAVIADSFDGRSLNDNFAANLLSEREKAKADLQARRFYEWQQGADWEKVVDLDTEALLKCAEEKRPLFHKPLTELGVPILLMGGKEDEMCRTDLEQEYREMARLIPNAAVHIFERGGHPAILSNAEEAAEAITEFIADN